MDVKNNFSEWLTIEKEKESIQNLPKGIYAERMVWFGAWKERNEKSEKLKNIEEQIYLEVLKQTDENGKKLYTNDILRKEAAQFRMNQIPEFMNLKKCCEELEAQMIRSQIRSEFLKNQFDVLMLTEKNTMLCEKKK